MAELTQQSVDNLIAILKELKQGTAELNAKLAGKPAEMQQTPTSVTLSQLPATERAELQKKAAVAIYATISEAAKEAGLQVELDKITTAVEQFQDKTVVLAHRHEQAPASDDLFVDGLLLTH